MDELRLFLLGPPEIKLGGAPLTIRSTKARAILFYLAVTARGHDRSHLAGLLWADLPETNARRNLRVDLHKLRQSLADYLLLESQNVALDPHAPCWVDVRALQEAHRRLETVGIHDLVAKPPVDLPDNLRHLVSYHRGDFLEGFGPPDAPAYEAWLTVQRQRCRLQLVQIHEALATRAETRGELAGAIRHARAVLGIDRWREEGHRRLMRLLLKSGRRSDALAQYEICRQVLADELQVEPAPATVALYDEARRAVGVKRDTRGSTTHNLPAETTSFIGRRAELAQIAELLADAGCRLLTLFGPGGMGKTRLALQAARRATDSYADGVFYVPLETVTAVEQLPEAIAGVIGLILTPQQDPWEQLLAYLHDRHMLLLLDNFEHLVSDAELLATMLRSAPKLKLLVTTREALKLYEEWLIEVQGLVYPAEDEASDAAHSEAAALFLQRARRVRPDFSLEGNEAAAARICRQLRGMPLAIELAAAWVHTMPPAEIARQINASLEVLATSLRNVPRRHRSISAVFDHSWQLLHAHEKQLLRRLAVFHGGFTESAAQQVAGASKGDLMKLVDKSLLRLAGNGRYDMHPLIHQYATDRLADVPEEERAVELEHAAYFAAFLSAEENALRGVEQPQALRRIAGEMDNVRTAWGTACAEPALLERMVTPFFQFLIKRGQQREGFALFARAVTKLEQRAVGSDTSPSSAALLARLLVAQGRLGEHISRDFDVPESLLSRGLALARTHDLPVECARALHGLGTVALLRRNIEQAGDCLAQSLDICRHHEIPDILGNVLIMFAWLRHAEGDRKKARAMAHEALALHRDSGDVTGVAAALTVLGTAHNELDEVDLAEEAFAEALALCRQSGHKVGESQALTGLFNVAYRQGDSERAAAYARQSVAVNREGGNRLGTAIAYHNLGAAAANVGRHQEAVEAYEEARDIYRAIKADGARRSNNHVHLAESLLALGKLSAARRELQEALRALPEQAHLRLGPAVLHAAAHLFSQIGDDQMAVRLARFLQEQALLTKPLDHLLTVLPADTDEDGLEEVTTIAQALSVVERRLAIDPGI